MFFEIINKRSEKGMISETQTGIDVAIIGLGSAAIKQLQNACDRFPLYSSRHTRSLVVSDEYEKLGTTMFSAFSVRCDYVFLLVDFRDCAFDLFLQCVEECKTILRETGRVICVTTDGPSNVKNYDRISSVVDQVIYTDEPRLFFQTIDMMFLTGLSEGCIGMDFADLSAILKAGRCAFYDEVVVSSDVVAEEILPLMIQKMEQTRERFQIEKWNFYMHFMLTHNTGLESLNSLLSSLMNSYLLSHDQDTQLIYQLHFDCHQDKTTVISWILCKVDEG